ncbi:hypothetical protein Leryth_005598 [Lithospermum erythrorhizon]|nr:hypothetical protein Leryth_005598 [Lithospermum erythrorhizon]
MVELATSYASAAWPLMMGGGGGRGGEANGRLRRMRKRTLLGNGRGASWNICCNTLVNITVWNVRANVPDGGSIIIHKLSNLRKHRPTAEPTPAQLHRPGCEPPEKQAITASGWSSMEPRSKAVRHLIHPT